MKKIILAATTFVILASTASYASAGIFGDTVKIDFQYPSAGSSYGGVNTTGTVTATGLSLNLYGNQLVTVFGNYVDMTSLRNSSFVSASFDGVEITDLTHPNAFTSASVDGLTTLAGFDQSRVSITNGNLFINYQGFNTPDPTLARVDFSTSPVPEPTESALMLSGLGLLGFMVSRKKSA